MTRSVGVDGRSVVVDGRAVDVGGGGIPDSAVTSFEQTDWDTNFNGQTSDFDRVTSNPFDETHNIQKNTDAYGGIAFKSTQLSQSDGYTFEVWIDKDGTTSDPVGPTWRNTSNNGYQAYIFNGGNVELKTVSTIGENGATVATFTTADPTPSSGYFGVKVQVSGSDFTVTFLNPDRSTLAGPYSATDTTYSGCEFIGVTTFETGVDIDLLQATPVQ